MAIIIIVGILMNEKPKNDVDYNYETGRVVEVTLDNTREDVIVDVFRSGVQRLKVEVLTGQFAGEIYNVEHTTNRLLYVYAEEGQTYIITVDKSQGSTPVVYIYTYQRVIWLIVLVLILFALTIIIGRWRGFKAIYALLFSVGFIILYLVPAAIAGQNLILWAIITTAVIIGFTVPFIHGINKKSLGAMLGTVLGLAAAGLITLIFGQLLHTFGIMMNENDSAFVLYMAERYMLQPGDLMFAMIAIASIGAIMDVGMSISSTITELKSVNKDLTPKQLYSSGLNVGRDIMGTMINTLVFAFVGTSLLTMMMISFNNMQSTMLLNLELLSVNVLQSVAGTIGIVLTIPFTAFIMSRIISAIGKNEQPEISQAAVLQPKVVNPQKPAKSKKKKKR